MEPVQSIEPNVKTWNNIRVALYILAAFILFLFALDLMTSSLQHMGKNVAETILQATSNPFTALFIGLLVTAMLQSSSTTTSLVVAGMDFNHVVKTTIFLKDMNNFPKVNETYGKYFQQAPPARETVEVSRLPKDVNVEISCIAVK